MSAYVDAVLAELGRSADQLEPKTIFLVVGRRVCCRRRLMKRILEKDTGSRMRSSGTIECNPVPRFSTVEGEINFAGSREPDFRWRAGALMTRCWTVLGRIHTEDSAVRSYEKLRAAGV